MTVRIFIVAQFFIYSAASLFWNTFGNDRAAGLAFCMVATQCAIIYGLITHYPANKKPVSSTIKENHD